MHPQDGRILDSRTDQPLRYWLTVAILAGGAALNLVMAWRYVGGRLPIPSLGLAEPWAFAGGLAVCLIGNAAYYALKARRAKASAYALLWLVVTPLLFGFVWLSAGAPIPDLNGG